MSLPNSNAHSDKAAEKPNINAMTAQRNGHGRWLRTIMRGALTDSLRRSSFQRTMRPAYAIACSHPARLNVGGTLK